MNHDEMNHGARSQDQVSDLDAQRQTQERLKRGLQILSRHAVPPLDKSRLTAIRRQAARARRRAVAVVAAAILAIIAAVVLVVVGPGAGVPDPGGGTDLTAAGNSVPGRHRVGK